MKQTLEAIFEHGMLRPLKRLSLPEGGHVTISIETSSSAQGEDTQGDDTVKEKINYDFSDLVGKLSWKGDPVTIQRALRNEW